MKTNNICCLLFVVFLLLANSSVSQYKSVTNKQHFKPNTIHLNPGTGIPIALYVSGFINYDRILKEKLFHRNINLFARASIGGTINWTDESIAALLQTGLFTGNKKSHFEIALGGLYLYTFHNASVFSPSGQIGYRYQKPQGSFVFRSGIGFPELFYIGLGVAF